MSKEWGVLEEEIINVCPVIVTTCKRCQAKNQEGHCKECGYSLLTIEADKAKPTFIKKIKTFFKLKDSEERL